MEEHLPEPGGRGTFHFVPGLGSRSVWRATGWVLGEVGRRPPFSPPRGDGPLAHGEVSGRCNGSSRSSKKQLDPETVAVPGKGPEGGVEPRTRRGGSISGNGEPRDRAGEVLGEGDALWAPRPLLARPPSPAPYGDRFRESRCAAKGDRRGCGNCQGESRVSSPSRTTIRSTTRRVGRGTCCV